MCTGSASSTDKACPLPTGYCIAGFLDGLPMKGEFRQRFVFSLVDRQQGIEAYWE